MTRPFPSDWRNRREEVLEKYGYECANCGRSGREDGSRIEIHHIVPRNAGGTHKLSNLAPLCAPCHSAVHLIEVQAPTEGPTIDYDKLAEAWHTPPDMRSEAQEQYLTQINENLHEYAEADDFQYYPSVVETNNIPTPSNDNILYLNNDISSKRWRYLQAKWSSEH